MENDGLTIDCDYANCEVHVSMSGYVEKALKCFKHTKPAKAHQTSKSTPNQQNPNINQIIMSLPNMELKHNMLNPRHLAFS